MIKKLFEGAEYAKLFSMYSDDDWVPDVVVLSLFDCTRQTIWRWEKEDSLMFPRAIKIGGKKYRKAGDLRRFRKRIEEDPNIIGPGTTWRYGGRRYIMKRREKKEG